MTEGEEGQAGPNQTWRVAAEPQMKEVGAERGGKRHYERQMEASVTDHGVTAPVAEPQNHQGNDIEHKEVPEVSGWELPHPETYGSRQQFGQGGTHQRQALAGSDGTTGSGSKIET